MSTLPKVYDSPHYRGNVFNPRARGVPEIESHISPEGNVTDPEEKPGFQPDPFAVELARIKKALVDDAAVQFAHGSRAVDRQADKFLRQHGAKLKYARGGSQLK